jgi:uncharacterized delta-60 repeat protein
LAAFTCPSRAQTPQVTIPSADGPVYSLAIQPDGKVVIGGAFGKFNDVVRPCLARLNPDGTLDTTFNPGASGGVGTNAVVYSLAPQPDGRILVGGNFTNLSGTVCNHIGRLNADGTLDQSFQASADFPVYTVCAQPDGMILAGGTFTKLNDQARDYIGRLDTNGVPDANFNPGADYPVYALAIQPDRRILVTGNFGWLGGQLAQHLGRLNTDGTLDNTFNSDADNTVICVAIQNDGKIIVGGLFATLAGQPRSGLGRLAPDGSLDASFVAQTTGGSTPFAYSLALQADGRILVGGGFALLSGSPRSSLGRINPDGTLDPSFDAEADKPIFSLGLQADGSIWSGGLFANLGGAARSCIGLLTNTQPSSQELTVQGSTVSWLRGGASPEISRALFETSTNGTDWTDLGEGNRIPGGWQLTNASVPTRASLRARGLVSGGYQNASTWFVQTMRPALFVDGLNANQIRLNLIGSAGQVVVVETSSDLSNWMPFTTNTLSAGVNPVIDPQPTSLPHRFYRAVLQ